MHEEFLFLFIKNSRQEQWKEFLLLLIHSVYSGLFFGEINDDGYKQQL